MKTLAYIIFLAISAGLVSAQTEPAHEWNVTLKVVDDTGQPVAGADAWVNYLTNHFSGPTDSSGIFTASHVDHSVQLAFQVQKSNYYAFGMQYHLGFHYDPARWNPNISVLLKRIKNPIPMYARVVNLGMPTFDKTVGFDLMVGDWVSPYGGGTNIDLIFTAHRERRAKNDSDYKLVVAFPKQGDGIQEFNMTPILSGSDFRSSYDAPSEGYQAEWIQTKISRPGQPMKTNWDMGRNYFFRVRTVLDSNGHVKSAFYGKIYGDFMQFTYYLNPTPNSRNMEFDPKHNLANLKFRESQVRIP